MVDFARMLALDDNRWTTLAGGYRTPLDPRALLSKLESGQDAPAVWRELWNELHHQGDVGEASYAAVPHLVDISRRRRKLDWNTYAMVAIIELARMEGSNPALPNWLESGYFRAIQELAEIGAGEVLRAEDPDTVRAILSVIAIAKGLRVHGKFLVNCSDEEMLEFEP
jgi:hypothetical protein